MLALAKRGPNNDILERDELKLGMCFYKLAGQLRTIVCRGITMRRVHMRLRFSWSVVRHFRSIEI